MADLAEPARAKVNLTLRVLGRRADGYHELESLVAFADVADRLELVPGPGLSLSVDGPFAADLDGPNLVLAAAEAAASHAPDLELGHFHLTKTLPVAAGIGGGSADAGAALRLILRRNPERAEALDIASLARALSSDAPVCLASRCAMMTGRGEIVRRLTPLPVCPIVLANPGVPLRTTDVFRALGARPLGVPKAQHYEEGPAAFADAQALAAYLRDRANDLETPALHLMPQIADVMRALSRQPGALLTRLSGSGPTCFALFATIGEAVRATETLSAQKPRWWVTASILG